ncbi:acyltransferase family protein [Streptomyces acidicola]|uniref:Acyltransferase n=1 Tax=Streptomyces acidicola TaxID=2596892 RepID=A0A5N8WWN9_9ACTN|nr:acyltransferase [Streptomyces acidicola]MPY51813.1 acyltransferase [Streptomyces acidicola]
MNIPAKTAPPTSSSQESNPIGPSGPIGAARPGIRPGDPSRRAGPDTVLVPPRTTRRAAAPRLRALDGLRLIAALMVAAYHYGGRDGEISQAWGTSSKQQFPTLHEWFAYGCLGVQIFFVISGFVICMSGWGRPLRSFFVSRASRLMPAYWAAVILVTVVFALPTVAYKAVSPSDALVNLTMLQQPLGVDRVLGVCWTLWAEVRFYALFALCVVLPGVTRSRVIMFCACWTLAAAIAQSANEPLLDTVLMPEYAPFFIGGMGLYLVHRDRRDVYAWGIVMVSWLIGQHYAVQELWHAPNPDAFSNRTSYGIVLVVTLGFVAVAAIALGWLNRINWPWLTVAGALTYPFYLVHEHLGWVSVNVLHQRLGLPAGATIGLTLLGMLVLAWALHRGVEVRLGPALKRSLERSRG